MKKLLIVTGSKHDLPLLAEIKRLLKQERILFEIKIISCHRDIKGLVTELDPKKLDKENIGAVLAIAHSVANLPAIVAGYLKESPITVIGVGVPKTETDKFSSLLSVVSVPKGVPLLNAGIGEVGLHNAALCCAKLLKRHG
ncbi:AIR carboxylase family protein [Candidatus Kaiserbacteria bacterium]|nr:AIR carboxylase family protein [Candidatus Kaiserbacteria bacterium]